ncbi:hypothetical protein SUGI_0132030 [Cryptomeria japonica]|nr:hypothetical protein SUGI_0132030 [Cryptomeria japonica]
MADKSSEGMADKSSEAMNVRFMINTRTQRIVYAEAGKEFVDFLFSFLSMPIGSILKLLYALESNRKIGSVSNLYDSMEKLSSLFLITDKSQLLDPKFITPYFNNSLSIEGGNYYVCSYLIGRGASASWGYYDHGGMNTTHNMSTSNTDICICGKPIDHLVQLRQNTNTSGSSSQTAGQAQGNSGYVKEMLTFIITDDLKIKGSSTITTITLLNQLSIKDLTDLEERTAIVDRNKALEILEASLISTTVLNDVFGAEFSLSRKACVEE